MPKKQKTQKVSTGYIPRPLQDKLHRALKRFNVLVCHRRFGKTVFSLNHMIDAGLRNQKHNPQYAYISPLYSQSKRIAWDYLKQFTMNIPGATPNEADLRVDIERPKTKDRIRFMLLGADNPNSLRGIYLDGGILDEFAEMDPTTWTEVIRPALSDRLGWAVFIGTPKGRNHFQKLYEHAKRSDAWVAALHKASETEIIAGEELQALKDEMDPDEYAQEMECSFNSGVVGAYYLKQLQEAEDEKRIGHVPYDKAVPVSTFWDLGIGDSTSIWFLQRVGQELHVIDYLEVAGEGLPEIARQVSSKLYNYEEHVLPHDAKARELGTGKTREEVLRGLRIGRVRILERQVVADGIQAVRNILNKCWFDEERCERGLEALRNYQKKWDSKKMTFDSKPLHNWASHGADAFRYLAMGIRDQSIDHRTLPRQAQMEYDLFAV